MRKLIYQDWKGGNEVITSEYVKVNWSNLNDVHNWVESANVGDKWEFKGNQDSAVFRLECIEVMDDANVLAYYDEDFITVGVRSVVPFKGVNGSHDGDYYFYYVNVPIETQSIVMHIGQYKVDLRNTSYFTFHDGMVNEYTIELMLMEKADNGTISFKKVDVLTLEEKEADNG